MSAMDTSTDAHMSDAPPAATVEAAAAANEATEAAASSPSPAAASSSAAPPAAAASASPAPADATAAAAAAAPAAADDGDDSDDDIVLREGMTEDEILAADAAPKKKRGRPAAAPAGPPVLPGDALERLNDLLAKTEQFSKFLATTKTEKKGRGKGGRHHERAEEEAEDKELVADELRQTETKTWPDHLDEQPTAVVKAGGLPMRDYQLEALNWLIKLHDQKLSGILADEMGLGKTLMSLSLLAYLKQYRGYAGPHLIIVPKSTSSNWLREVKRWTNNLSVFKFHGNAEERERCKPLVAEHDITITTYEMVIMEKAFFSKVKWHYLYIDEAHRIKNENSLLSRVVRTFSTEHRLLITGTPLQNNLHELWALLNFLVPSLFHSSDDFAQWFALENTEQRGEIVARLHRLLRPFLLRRLKSEVEKALLPKIETKLFVGMSEMQKAWYKKILERDIEVLNASNTSKVRLLNIVMQLRKHPYLFESAEPGPPYLEGEHIVTNSSKMVLLDKLLKKLQADNHRVLIFSQMTRVLDILEDYTRYRGYQYCRIDGSSKQDERDEAMEAFNAPNSEKFIFLLSTRAGGLGINLQTADTVILFDSDWNPQMDLQAMDRAHRIGQKKQVTVFRFVVEHTIEQKMVERATKKLFLDALVVKQGKLHDADKSVGAQELQEMVRFGANRIFQGTDSEVTDADIDLILSRGREMTTAESEKLKQSANTDLLNFSLTNDAQTNFQVFEGRDYTGTRAKTGFDFIEPAARSRKSNYDINAYYRDALRVTDKKNARQAKEFKPTQRFDYQFFNIERLEQLERKDFESKQKLYNLKLAVRMKKKEEKRAEEEAEKEARRKARYQARKQKKLAAQAAAAAAGVAVVPGADEKSDEDEGSDEEDAADKAAAPAAAAAAEGAAADATATAAPADAAADSAVKMELDEPVKKEDEPAAATAAAAAAASPAPAAADAAKTEGAAEPVKMETDDATTAAAADATSTDAAAAAPAAAADADADAGRRKSHRARNSTSKDGAPSASPAQSPLPSATPSAEPADDDEHDGEDDAALEAELMAEAGCLSTDEREEMERLQAEGFGTWSRRHLVSLTKAMEKYGRDDLSNIKVSVDEKTPDEVEKYYYAFWQKGAKCIKDFDRIHKQIERGEQKLAKQKALQVVIDRKVRAYKNNFEAMSIPYPTASHKSFTEDEDKFLLVQLHRLGYGNWEDLKASIRASWMFRFDWFFKSRTCGELSKRTEYLLKILEKEQEGWDAAEKKAKEDAAKKRARENSKAALFAMGISPSKKKASSSSSDKADKGDKGDKADKAASSSSSSSKKEKSDKSGDKDDGSSSTKKKHSSSSSHKDKGDKEGKSDKKHSSSSSHKDKGDKEKEKKGDKEHKSSKSSHKDKEHKKEHKDKEKHKSDKSEKSSSSSSKKPSSSSSSSHKSDKKGDDKESAGKKRKETAGSSDKADKSASRADDEHKAKKHKTDKEKSSDKSDKPKPKPAADKPATASAAAAPSAMQS